MSHIPASIDLNNKVNIMYPAFVKKLGLLVRKTDMKVQKTDGSNLETVGIVIVAFLVIDKADKVRFFEETFLLANVNIDVVLGMLFFTLSNANIGFSNQDLT